MSESSAEEGSSDEEIDLSHLWRTNPFASQRNGQGNFYERREENFSVSTPVSAFSSFSSSRSVDSLRVQTLQRNVAHQRPFSETSSFGGEIYRPRRLLEHRRSLEAANYSSSTSSGNSQNLDELRQTDTVQLPRFSNDRMPIETVSTNRRAEFLKSRPSSASNWRSEERDHIFNESVNTYSTVPREPVAESRFLLPTIFEEEENNVQYSSISQEDRVELVTNLLMRSLNTNNYAGEQINRRGFRPINRFLSNSYRMTFHPPYNGRRSMIGSIRNNTLPNLEPSTRSAAAGAVAIITTSSTPGTNIQGIIRSSGIFYQRRIPRLSIHQCETFSYPSTISLTPSTSTISDDQDQEQQQQVETTGFIDDTSNERNEIVSASTASSLLQNLSYSDENTISSGESSSSSVTLFSLEQNERVENIEVSEMQENRQSSSNQENGNNVQSMSYFKAVRVSPSSSSNEDDVM